MTKRLGSDHYFNNYALIFAETGSLNHFEETWK